ncbi:MAG: CRISPR-associated helicase Cas3' [Candidatus Nezhaarchaeales archaeon]
MQLRPLIQRALEAVDKLLSEWTSRKETFFILIEAPTGYGKTISAPIIFNKLVKSGIAGSILHVLPLRAIVKDFYLCKLVYSMLENSDGELIELCKDKTPMHSVIENALKEIGLKADDLGYQMGEIIEVYGKKEPLFATRYTVTTLDSFLYNLYRIPVTEIFSRKKHYAIPRLRIFLSGVFFDEAHMIFEEESDVKLFETSIKALEVLLYMRVPVIIASATLSETVAREILKIASNKTKVKRVKLCENESKSIEENTVCVADKEFVEKANSISWRTKIIKEKDIIDISLEALNSGKAVFIACDTVHDAIARYKLLSSRDSIRDKIVLLHGRLTRKDRESAFSKLKDFSNKGEGFILVATSVVEAGVDISFDVLITDLTDVSRVPSFIQRCGRICRNLEKCKDSVAEIYVVESETCSRDEKCNELLRFLKKHPEDFIPRIPFNYEGRKGYGELLAQYDKYLEEISKDLPPGKNFDKLRQLNMLGSALFVSSRIIDSVLSDENYTLVRTSIFEVIVGKENENTLDSKRSIPLPENHINRILSKRPNCIKSVMLLDDRGSIVYRIPVEEVLKNKSELDVRKYYRKIKDILKDLNLKKRIGEIRSHGFLLLDECYEQGLGIVVDLNR